jgi:hypothetical protein
MIASEHILYERIIHVTEDYLGPAAKRFVDRQIVSHLNKPPERILPEDIPALTEWTAAVFSLLTEDHRTVQEFTRRLEELAGKQNR